MRYSARRAWHETFYHPQPDKLELLGQQTTNLSSTVSRILLERAWSKTSQRWETIRRREITHATPTRSAKSPWINPDVMILAKVQSTIYKLPAELQIFGHFCYGPWTDSVKIQLHELALPELRRRVWISMRGTITDSDKARDNLINLLNGLTDLLLVDHRLRAFGSQSKYLKPDNPSRISSDRQYSTWAIAKDLTQLGAVIEPKLWGREVERYYDIVMSELDGMERETLRPISELLTGIYEAWEEKLLM